MLSPSASVMPETSALSSWPTVGVPAIVGLPAGTSLTALTSMVRVLAAALSSVPSLTLKVKLA